MNLSEIRAMKTKSSPRAAFLNLRFLIGLLVLTCGLVTLLTWRTPPAAHLATKLTTLAHQSAMSLPPAERNLHSEIALKAGRSRELHLKGNH